METGGRDAELTRYARVGCASGPPATSRFRRRNLAPPPPRILPSPIHPGLPRRAVNANLRSRGCDAAHAMTHAGGQRRYNAGYGRISDRDAPSARARGFLRRKLSARNYAERQMEMIFRAPARGYHFASITRIGNSYFYMYAINVSHD